MTAFRRFDDVAVGDVFPAEPLTFEVSRQVVDGFLAATGNESDLYAGGERRAPSMIASVYLINLLLARRSPPGGIHAKQAIRFHRALEVGETVWIQGRVVEKFVRKERRYVVADFETRGGDGSLVSSGRISSIWGRDP